MYMMNNITLLGAHKPKMLRIYLPRVVAKSLWHFKVLYNKSKIQRRNENKLN